MVKLHNLLFPQLTGEWANVNLNALSLETAVGKVNPLISPIFQESWVIGIHKRLGVKQSYGGYLEDRSHMWRGHYHRPGHFIHLGVDYNVPVIEKVYLPFDGELIHSTTDPDQEGGWGHQLIFKTNDLFVIFGHLTQSKLEIGRTYKKGTCIGRICGSSGNGGWFPHLHVQCCRELDIKVDGYGPLYDGIEKDFPNPEEVLKS